MSQPAAPDDKAIYEYLDAHPNRIYSSGYDDVITTEMANHLLKGEFEKFDDAVQDSLSDYAASKDFWAGWEEDFASHFGYENWAEVPEDLKETVVDNRSHDESDWIESAIKHWHGYIVATVTKPGEPEIDNLIYAPSNWVDSDDQMDERDIEQARYLIETFDPEIPDGAGTPEERLRNALDIVYGGYDREALVLCGKIDLLEIYKSRKAPAQVEIGPRNKDNLLFYEHSSGCGNMGMFKPGKTVTMPATFEEDGSRGYGVQSCYGFVGSWWRHEIKAMPAPEPELAVEELPEPSM